MSHLSRLKGSQRVRQQVNVMFGNTDIRGCQQSIFEVGSNSIDRFKKGFGNYIRIVKHKNISYTIEDFADGLPMTWNEEEQGYDWDLALKTLYAGDNYKKDSEAIGAHGLGLTTTQYSSEYMNVISYRDGKKYTVKFKKGRPIDKNTSEFVCDDDDFLFTKEQGEKVLLVEDYNNIRTGTIIHYKPDIEVFSEIDVPVEWIIDKFKKQAFVNKGLTIDIIDELNNKTYTLYYENGIKDYIKEISNDKNLINVVNFQDKARGKDREDKKEYDVRYELVFTFNNELNSLHYYHNSSELLQGGVTAKAIEKAFVDIIHDYIDKNGMYNNGEKKIKFSDIEDSLICIISSFSTYTSYSNQTKLSIDNEFIKEFITESLKKQLEIYFTENSIQANLICSTILNNMRARTKAEKTKLNIKKQLEGKSSLKDKIKNFYDCVTDNPEEAEIYVAEGASAQGSVIMGRNAEFQACIHVGGKMLSLLKANYEQIFKNKVVVQLFRKLGCGIEVRDKNNKELNCFDENNLKFHKIILATDSDTDAYNIRSLILTCLFRLAPTLIEKGYVYIAESPLYEITDLKGNLLAHVYTEQEKIDKLKELNTLGIKYSNPERNKGLGEVEPEIIAETMMNPETRKITQVTVADAKKMAEKFDLWLGENVTPRKEVITNNFDYVEYFEPITKKDITQVLDENYLPYAIEVVKERSIIAIDGFKPSHRKLLWTLHEMNLYGKRSKSLNVVGSNTAYNIHGDGAIYSTLIRMGQKDTLLYPYVNSKGNFGQHTSRDLQEAHSRYTESGANEINKEFFKDINKNAVDFIPNFDGQKSEPTLLPTTFPNVLVNCNKGIAVGMASCTASFNLNEVCDLTIQYMTDKNLKVSDYLLAPDFATKGYVIKNAKVLDDIYETGKGSIKLRGKYYTKNNSIFITEIPYTTTREVIIEQIENLIENKIIDDITKVIDATDLKKGMCIQLNIKKNCNVDQLMNLIYNKTKLEDTYSFNMNIICLDKIPRVLGIKGILDEWFKFRYNNLNRVIQFDKKKKQDQLHILEGMAKVLLDIDKLINIIRYSESDEDSLIQVMEYFKIDEKQAKEVIDMPFKNINKMNFIKRTSKIKILKDEIKDLSSKENNIEYFNSVIKEQLINIKNKYGMERKTIIINEEEIKNIDIKKEDFIKDNTVTIVLTKDQYLKKNQKYSENQTVKENDEVLQVLQTTNKKDLLMFTNQGRVFARKIYEFTGRVECTPSALGEFIPNILKDNLQPDEKIIYIASPETYNKGYMLYIFENNNIVKMAMKPYYSSQNRMKPQEAFNTESPLKYIKYIPNDIDILTLSSEGKMLIQNTESINPKASNGGKKSQGNSFMKLDNNITLVGVVFEPKEDDIIKFKTEKKDCVEINLADICQSSKDKLTYYNHCLGKKNNAGNFIYNCRQKNDKIIGLIK